MTRRWHLVYMDEGHLVISLESYGLWEATELQIAPSDRVFRRPLIFGFTRMVWRIRKAYS